MITKPFPKANKSLQRLMMKCRKLSGYQRHIWEPAMDFEESEPNFPFKPEGPRADKWGGELGDWQTMKQHCFVGATFWGLHKLGENAAVGREIGDSDFWPRQIREALAILDNKRLVSRAEAAKIVAKGFNTKRVMLTLARS